MSTVAAPSPSSSASGLSRRVPRPLPLRAFARPKRPGRLAIVIGGLLAGSCGLAWWMPSPLASHSVTIAPAVLGFLGGAGITTVSWVLAHAWRRDRARQSDERRVAAQQEASTQAAQQALAAREAFLGMAGHELRSPVTGAMLHAQRWARRCQHGAADPAELAGAWQRQVRQLGRLARLMEGLLDASHLSNGSLQWHPQPLDVCVLVRDVVDRLSEAACRAGCPVALHLPRHGLHGHFDRLRLEQVVENLLGNALQYGAGKPIDMTVQRRHHEMHLTVRDQGIGIPEADQARIFACYERVVPVLEDDGRPAGLGLGLWLVQHIVAAAGGQVSVHSAPNCGATFVVRLPC